jgi:hypothetical protein
MTQQHPITPPQWQMDAWQARIETMGADVPAILLEVAQWGADQELEAIIQLAGEAALPEKDRYFDGLTVAGIMAARRLKPPSLKEQALLVLDDANLDAAHHNILLRALEQLDA